MNPTLRNMIRAISGLVSIACFAGLIGLLLIFAIKLVSPERSGFFIMLESALPYLFVPAYFALLFALISRRRILTALSVITVLAHIALLAPEIRFSSSLPPASKEVGRLTVLSHNMYYDNWSSKEYADFVHKQNADVIFLQELTERVLYRMEDYAPFRDYPYSFVEPLNSPVGIGIYSKYPILSKELVGQPNYPDNGFLQMHAIIDVNGRQVSLWNAHVNAPVDPPFSDWKNDLSLLQQRLHADNTDVIAAGDFNATFQHKSLRKLVSKGYREGFRDRGKWYELTWPVGKQHHIPLDGVLRLDHVLTRGKLRIVDIETLPPYGSDHKAVHAVIALYR